MRKKLFILCLTLSLLFSITPIPSKASGDTASTLGDLPVGAIVYDPSWKWEYRTGMFYTGDGETKPVEWIVVAKDHYKDTLAGEVEGNHITLLTKDLIARFIFDNKEDMFVGTMGENEWGESGSGDGVFSLGVGVKPFLNGETDEYFDGDENFYEEIGSLFKNAILDTKLYMKTYWGYDYTTNHKIFLPSQDELGGGSTNTVTLGTDWGYFNTNDSRKVTGISDLYWTRSPFSENDTDVRTVKSTGEFGNNSAFSTVIGVRPALNLNSDALVYPDGEGKYTLFKSYKKPVITINDPSQGEWTNQDIAITATTDQGTLNTDRITFTENGTFTFIAEDEWGNVEEKEVIITNIDKEKPKMKITIGKS